MSDAKWIGVDFDGTLAENGRHGERNQYGDGEAGPPIPAMVARVMALIAAGYRVKILTARARHDAVKAWCLAHLGVELEVTREKDPGLIALYDDRAIRVERNSGRVCRCFPVAADTRPECTESA